MKFSELRTPSGRPLPLHPRLAVIEANAEIRSQVLTALRNAMRPGGSAAGYVEVHGVLLDFDRETLRVLDLDPAPELVLDAASIPIEAYGSAGRRPHIVDDVATNDRDLVDPRRHEVQVALDVVAIMQAALRAATDERDRAAGAFATASGELADAIASRDAAYRAVESLADAVQDDPDDDIVEAELVVEEPPDVDPWAEQRVTRLDAVDAAERRVLEARAEVEQSARAANPARLDQHDRAALEAAHDAVLDADERAGRRLGGASARKRLDEARAAERVVLDRLGLDSYSDFLLRSSMGATDPSAELRLEIARTELMEAERALTVARVASEAVPDPLPSEPAVAGSPGGRRSTGSPEGVAASRVGRGRSATRSGDPSSRRRHRGGATCTRDLQRGRRGVGRRRGQASRAVGSPRRSGADARPGACSSRCRARRGVSEQRASERPRMGRRRHRRSRVERDRQSPPGVARGPGPTSARRPVADRARRRVPRARQ